ncbi:DUF4132 domain-containing protein [Streptomyces sp. T-3]|nr:DUF4132 domain-containing protein [Streptomyces sp. T-3]
MTTGGVGLQARLYEVSARQRQGDKDALRMFLDSLLYEECRTAAQWLHAQLCAGGVDDVNLRATQWVARQSLGWTPAEADALLRRLGLDDPTRIPDGLPHFAHLLWLPLAAAEQARACDQDLLRAARATLAAARELQEGGPSVDDMLARLDSLIVPPPEDGTLAAKVLDHHDQYGPAMRAAHQELLASPGIAELLLHCTTQGKVRPTKRWSKEAAALLEAAGEPGPRTLRVLLEGLAAQPEHHVTTPWWVGDSYNWPAIVGGGNETLARGLLWTAAPLDADWVVRLTAEVALNAGTGMGGSGGYCRNGKLATSAVAALGTFGGARGEEAVAWLGGRLKAKIRNRTVQKGITKSLEEVAERSGLTPAMLRERAVPQLGLDSRGMREEKLGEYAAVLAVEAPGSAALTFRGPDGQILKTAPKAMRETYADELKAVRAALKELRATLTTERSRLEEQLMAGTRWSARDWALHCVEHPVTGALGRTLLWEGSDDDGASWTAGLAERTGAGWALATADGLAVPVLEGTRLRLWHPLRSTTDEIRAWREELTDRELRQPFKQAFREIYPLTPAERETAVYSNRFAAHVLRYPQARALMTARGWHGNHLGHHEDGDAAEMVRELPRPGELRSTEGEYWRARFYIEQVEADGDRYDVELCATDQVRFERRRGPRGAWTGAELVDVPPQLLSEALRDVDLFVGVASIGADPQWQDRGADRLHHDYWHRWSFGELTESARIRRQALARLLPRTRIADRVELTERFLRVRGELRTYRIHLGSGNVLMEPDDAYLCIVADRSRSAGEGKDRLFLPFEEDGGPLALILSKAFLLADDARIRDRSITSQILR